MSAKVPEKFRPILETKALAHLATLMKDGTPQVSPVWFDTVGDRIRVNSARGRTKDLNMKARPQVALSIVDPENDYRHIALRGRVVEITEQGADDVIDGLAKKYLGADKYPFRQPGEVRVTYLIEIDNVVTMG